MMEFRNIAGVDVALYLERHEQWDDADRTSEFVERVVSAGRLVGYMPHVNVAGVRTYRARVFVVPLPDQIADFVGPTRDLSKATGLLAYRGMLSETFGTHDTKTPDYAAQLAVVDEAYAATRKRHLLLNRALLYREMGTLGARRLFQWALDEYRAWAHEYTGDGRALGLILEGDVQHEVARARALYAQAITISPVPEAFIKLARLTRSRSEEVHLIERAWAAADARMDGWDWSPAVRFFEPASTLIDYYVDQKRLADASAVVARVVAQGGVEHIKRAQQLVVDALAYRRQRLSFYAEGVIADALHAAGYTIAPIARGADIVITTELAAAQDAWFCPLENLERLDTETVMQLMATRGILALSQFQADRLRRNYPFLPVGHIKVVPWGLRSIGTVTDRQAPAIAVGAGSDGAVTDDILARVSAHVPGAYVTDDLESARLWIYFGTDEPVVPAALLHAQAQGCVPVCVGAGSLPEYVKFGYFLRPPVTAEAFKKAAADRIVQLLNDEGDRLSRVVGGRDSLEKHPWSTAIEYWIDACV